MTALLDVLRLDTAVGPVNLIVNHSGTRGGTSGWNAGSLTGTTGLSSPTGLSYGEAGQVIRLSIAGDGAAERKVRLYAPEGNAFSSAPSGQQYYGQSWRLKRVSGPTGATIRAVSYARFRSTATGGTLETSIGGELVLNDARSRRLASLPFVGVPADANRVRPVLELTVPAGSATHVIDVWHVTAGVAPAAADVRDLAYRDPGDGANINILGNSLELRLTRGNTRDRTPTDTIEPGQLTAVIRDPAASPAVNKFLRPGQRVRLRALVAGKYRNIATPRVDRADVDYEGKVDPVTRVTLEASDAIATLANTPSPYVSTGNYRQRLENALGLVRALVYAGPAEAGATYPLKPFTPSDSSTALTQLERIRDTHHGALHVDGDDAIRAYAAGSLPNPAGDRFTHDLVLTDQPTAATVPVCSYIDLDRDFGTDQLVNTLYIERTNLTEEDGAKTFGPYVANDSEGEWGAQDGTVTVVDGDPDAHAAYFLADTTQPSEVVKSVTVLVDPDQPATLEAATLELYRTIRVLHGTHDRVYRLIRVEHSITATRWTVTMHLKPAATAAVGDVVLPPGGAGTGPGDLDPEAPVTLTDHASRYRSTNFAIAAAQVTAIPLDSFWVESGEIPYDNTNRWWTVQKDGLYLITASVMWDTTTGAGPRAAYVAINGVTRRTAQPHHAVANHYLGASVNLTIRLAKGTRVGLHAWSSVATNVVGNATGTSADITYLGS